MLSGYRHDNLPRYRACDSPPDELPHPYASDDQIASSPAVAMSVMSALVAGSRSFVERRVTPYAGARAVLATMHGKEAAIAPVFLDWLGLNVELAPNLDTDVLGTFTGERLRAGTMREAAIAKARLGMVATGLPIGLASEGSYGPHPTLPFAAGGIELMVLVDDVLGIVASEYLIEDVPAYHHTFAETIDRLAPFLDRVGFPSHGVIVKPAQGRLEVAPIYKGLRSRPELARAILECAGHSPDKRALIQSDMRAHMNPTRMETLRRLALLFTERLATPCPGCGMPGYGQLDIEIGLPCEVCGAPNTLLKHRVFGCVACAHREQRLSLGGITGASPKYCPQCNP